MKYSKEDLQGIKTLVKNAKNILIKTSMFQIDPSLNHPNTHKHLKRFSYFPSEETIREFTEQMKIIKTQYKLDVLEKLYIELMILHIGKFIALKIWKKSGISLDSKTIQDLQRAINITRFYEHTISVKNKGKDAQVCLNYLYQMSKSLEFEFKFFESNFKVKNQRKNNYQTQTTKQRVKQAIGQVVLLLDKKELKGNTAEAICTDVQNLYNTLYEDLEPYSYRTIENIYREFKKINPKERERIKKLIQKKAYTPHF